MQFLSIFIHFLIILYISRQFSLCHPPRLSIFYFPSWYPTTLPSLMRNYVPHNILFHHIINQITAARYSPVAVVLTQKMTWIHKCFLSFSAHCMTIYIMIFIHYVWVSKRYLLSLHLSWVVLFWHFVHLGLEKKKHDIKKDQNNNETYLFSIMFWYEWLFFHVLSLEFVWLCLTSVRGTPVSVRQGFVWKPKSRGLV